MKRLLLTFSFLSFLFLMPSKSFESYAASYSPTLTIESPKAGDVIKGFVVSVQFSVKGLVLKDYRTVTKPVVGQGYLNFWLDNAAMDPIKARKWSKDTNYVFADVTPGDHTITAALVGNDGLPLNPAVSQTVSFKTEDPSGAAPKGAVKDLNTNSATSNTGNIGTNSNNKTDFISSNKTPLIVGVASLILGILSFIFLKK